MTFGFLMNDDIFISYYRNDADLYAVGLDNELTKKGYSCFTDHRGTDAGRMPAETLFRKIQGCKMLVLLGSGGAVASDPVAQEVERFAKANGTSRIVPVSFDRGEAPAEWKAAGWFEKVEGIKRAREKREALDSGKPSDDVIERIEKQFSYAKSKDRLRKYRNRTLVTLLFLLAASVMAGLIAVDQSAKAFSAKQEADKAVGEADKKISAAQEQVTKAEGSVVEANRKLKDAEEKTTDAQHKVELANAASADAEKRRSVAVADARRQGEIAAERRREADRQSQIARARQSISRGELAKNQGADRFARPVELGLEASLHHQSFEPDSLLRYGLDRLPRLTASLPHQGPVQAAAFGTDGQTLSTLSSGDNTARVWDVAAKRELSSLSYGPQASVTLSSDGRLIAVHYPKQSGPNQSARVFDLTSGRKDEVTVLNLDEPITSVAFSEGGQYVAVGGAKKGVKVWEIIRMEKAGPTTSLAFQETATIPPSERGNTNALFFSGDGRRLAVISTYFTKDEDDDDILRDAVSVWDVNPVKKLYEQAPCRNVRLSHDGRYLAFSFGGNIQVDRIDPDSTENTEFKRSEYDTINGVALSPGAEFTASAVGKTVHLYFLQEEGREVGRLEHDDKVTHVSFVLQDKVSYIVTITEDRMAHLWARDARDQKHVRLYEAMRIRHEGTINQMVFGPKPRIVATISDDGTARVWEKMNGAAIAAIDHGEASREHVSNNGRFIAGASANEAWVWDTRSRQLVNKFQGTFQGTDDIVVSDDGKYLISGGSGSYGIPVRSWDTSTGKSVSLGPPDHRLHAASRDGQYIATGSDDPRQLRLWDNYGKSNGALHTISLNADLERVAFSPGGMLFAIVSKDRVVSVRETPTNNEVIKLERAPGVVAFSPDETTFAAAGEDKVVRVFKRKSGGRTSAAEVARFSVPEAIWRLVYSPEGNHIGVLCQGGKVLLWINMRKDALPIEHDSAVLEIAFSRRGRYFVAGFDDGAVRIRRTADGGKAAEFKYGTTISKFAFTPDERYLAISTSMHDRKGDPEDDQTVFVWDVDKNENVIRMDYQEYIRHIAFDAQGRYLHVISDGQTAQVLWLPQDMFDEAHLRLSANTPQ